MRVNGIQINLEAGRAREDRLDTPPTSTTLIATAAAGRIFEGGDGMHDWIAYGPMYHDSAATVYYETAPGQITVETHGRVKHTIDYRMECALFGSSADRGDVLRACLARDGWSLSCQTLRVVRTAGISLPIHEELGVTA